MRKLNGALAAALAAVAAAGLTAGTASAQNLDIGELAAAVALPFITGDQGKNGIKNSTGDVIITNQSAVTLLTVTNGKSEAVILKVDLISGDSDATPGGPDNWESLSIDCPLTARETATFVFTPNAAGTAVAAPGSGESVVWVECSTLVPQDTEGFPQAYTVAQNGIFWAAVADPVSGDVISEDIIFADAVVVDIQRGQAYSFEAISFQAGAGNNNGDKVYQFGVPNGAAPPFAQTAEYQQWPSALGSNFIAPRVLPAGQGRVNAELILITLDGTTGNFPPPRVAIGGFTYNDDEEGFDWQWSFDCFDIVALEEINSNFLFNPGSPLGLGSISGHLQMVPQAVSTANDAHDALFGNGNNNRRRPVHGWIVQNVESGQLLTSNQPIWGVPTVTVANGPAAWGRPITQTTLGFTPAAGDVVVLDADPFKP